MPEYLAPGIYVEEIDTQPRAIEGVSTSTAGAVGVTLQGPTAGQPVLVTSYAEFARHFGGTTMQPSRDTQAAWNGNALEGGQWWHFALAVRAFFDNGGQRLYVQRAFAGGGLPQAARTQANTACFASAELSGSSFVVTAKARGAYGNDIRVRSRSCSVAAIPLRTVEGSTLLATQVRVLDATRLYAGAIVKLDEQALQIQRLDDDIVTFSEPPAGAHGADACIRLTEIQLTVQHVSTSGVETEEIFENLRLTGDANDIVIRINEGSTLIDLAESTAPRNALAVLAYLSDETWRSLSGGDDRFELLSPADFIGCDAEGERTGIEALRDIDEIRICLVPGLWSRSVQTALIQQCEALRDRFAIIDPPAELDVAGVCAWRDAYDSSYAALYYPWVEAQDATMGQGVQLAPSAHIAGIYARVDTTRGVHRPAANETVAGVTGLVRTIGAQEHEMLNSRSINALRFFTERGHRVWGARTLAADPEWKYVNVRRLFIFIEQSISAGTQWAVFEPNTEATWARVRGAISNFLSTVWRGGALLGATQDDAFFVKCDRSTMTQDDIDNGRLICIVGIAPLRPAEFVIVRIGHFTLAAE